MKFAALLFLLPGLTFADESFALHRRAQLWKKALDAPSPLAYEPLGPLAALDAALVSVDGKIAVAKRIFETGGMRARVSLYLSPAGRGSAGEAVPPFVTVQTRIEEIASGRLVAECSQFAGLASADAGVGACSGVFGNDQIGLSIAK